MSDVSTVTAEAKAMHDAAKLPRTLMGGTKAMRAAGVIYLPSEPAEDEVDYKRRLNRSTLFNGFRKTVKDMTGKVFRREIDLGKDVPTQIVDWCENIDLAGRHINVFARDAFYDAMVPGIGFIFTDMPAALPGATLAQEQAAGIRPYLCYIKVEDVLGWKTENIAGVVTLTQFRFKEIATVADAYVDIPVEQIRVLTVGGYEVWRVATDGADKGKWVKIAEGARSIKDIPIAPVYINRTGFMQAEPPLEDLADLNVAHWQSQSDQRNILHVARVPILFWAGKNDDDVLVVGPNSVARSSDPGAKLEWVEHSGQAIGAGDTDLKNLEQQMQTQGLALLIATPGGKTATGENLDNEKENSPLAMMANALGDAIEASFGFMAQYANLGDGGSVTVNTDFGVTMDGVTVQQLLDMRNSGQISQETFLNEMKRRDVLSESVEVEAEIERTKNDQSQEAPAGKGMKLDE